MSAVRKKFMVNIFTCVVAKDLIKVCACCSDGWVSRDVMVKFSQIPENDLIQIE